MKHGLAWDAGAADAVIDRAHLDRQTDGDRALARELLDLFAGQCRTLLPMILDPGRPAPERADHAHTLRGSAAAIGAVGVVPAAGAVEDALRRGAAADEDLAALRAAVAAVLPRIGSA